MPRKTTAGSDATRPHLRRSLLGYRRSDVDAFAFDCEGQLVELREELIQRTETISALEAQLTDQKTQLRFWEDQGAFIESEVGRARDEAERIRSEMHERATGIEAAAQQRALQMVDRVAQEAETMLRHARDESREIRAQHEREIESARERAARMTGVQLEVSQALRTAMHRFETGLHELDRVKPSEQVRAALGNTPVTTWRPSHVSELQEARTTPTFGRTKALEALQKIDDDHSSSTGASGPAAAALRVVQGDPRD